jgi:hypothetical protein
VVVSHRRLDGADFSRCGFSIVSRLLFRALR